MNLLQYIDERLSRLRIVQQTSPKGEKTKKKTEEKTERQTEEKSGNIPESKVSDSTIKNLEACRRVLAAYLAAGRGLPPSPAEGQSEGRPCSAAPAAEAPSHRSAAVIAAAKEAEADIPLLTPLVPGWLADFAAWLASGYISPYGKRPLSPTAVKRHLQTLRTTLRTATAEGLFPDIDIFADLAGEEDPRERRGVRHRYPELWICRAAVTFPDSHSLLRRLVARHLGYSTEPLAPEEEEALSHMRLHLDQRAPTARSLRHTRRVHWYALRVYGRSGAEVERQLTESALLPPGSETYAPHDTKTRVARDGSIRETDDRLVTRLLFVRTDPQSIKEAAYHLGKVYLYTNPDSIYGRVPAIIPVRQIEQLRFMLRHAPGDVEITTEFKRGMRVRVTRGPLRGFVGEVVEAPGGQRKLSLMIDHVGCATLRISPADVAAI